MNSKRFSCNVEIGNSRIGESQNRVRYLKPFQHSDSGRKFHFMDTRMFSTEELRWHSLNNFSSKEFLDTMNQYEADGPIMRSETTKLSKEEVVLNTSFLGEEERLKFLLGPTNEGEFDVHIRFLLPSRISTENVMTFRTFREIFTFFSPRISKSPQLLGKVIPSDKSQDLTIEIEIEIENPICSEVFTKNFEQVKRKFHSIFFGVSHISVTDPIFLPLYILVDTLRMEKMRDYLLEVIRNIDSSSCSKLGLLFKVAFEALELPFIEDSEDGESDSDDFDSVFDDTDENVPSTPLPPKPSDPISSSSSNNDKEHERKLSGFQQDSNSFKSQFVHFLFNELLSHRFFLKMTSEESKGNNSQVGDDSNAMYGILQDLGLLTKYLTSKGRSKLQIKDLSNAPTEYIESFNWNFPGIEMYLEIEKEKTKRDIIQLLNLGFGLFSIGYIKGVKHRDLETACHMSGIPYRAIEMEQRDKRRERNRMMRGRGRGRGRGTGRGRGRGRGTRGTGGRNIIMGTTLGGRVRGRARRRGRTRGRGRSASRAALRGVNRNEEEEEEQSLPNRLPKDRRPTSPPRTTFSLETVQGYYCVGCNVFKGESYCPECGNICWSFCRLCMKFYNGFHAKSHDCRNISDPLEDPTLNPKSLKSSSSSDLEEKSKNNIPSHLFFRAKFSGRMDRFFSEIVTVKVEEEEDDNIMDDNGPFVTIRMGDTEFRNIRKISLMFKSPYFFLLFQKVLIKKEKKTEQKENHPSEFGFSENLAEDVFWDEKKRMLIVSPESAFYLQPDLFICYLEFSHKKSFDVSKFNIDPKWIRYCDSVRITRRKMLSSSTRNIYSLLRDKNKSKDEEKEEKIEEEKVHEMYSPEDPRYGFEGYVKDQYRNVEHELIKFGYSTMDLEERGLVKKEMERRWKDVLKEEEKRKFRFSGDNNNNNNLEEEKKKIKNTDPLPLIDIDNEKTVTIESNLRKLEMLKRNAKFQRKKEKSQQAAARRKFDHEQNSGMNSSSETSSKNEKLEVEKKSKEEEEEGMFEKGEKYLNRDLQSLERRKRLNIDLRRISRKRKSLGEEESKKIIKSILKLLEFSKRVECFGKDEEFYFYACLLYEQFSRLEMVSMLRSFYSRFIGESYDFLEQNRQERGWMKKSAFVDVFTYMFTDNRLYRIDRKGGMPFHERIFNDVFDMMRGEREKEGKSGSSTNMLGATGILHDPSIPRTPIKEKEDEWSEIEF